MMALNNTQRDYTSPERRRHTRLQDGCTIETAPQSNWHNPAEFLDAHLENISLGGVLLNSKECFDHNTKLKLKIKLPGWKKHCPGTQLTEDNSNEKPFTAVCEVLRIRRVENGYEHAARFIGIAPRDYIGLQGYLEDSKESGKNLDIIPRDFSCEYNQE